MKFSDYYIGSDSPVSALFIGPTGTGKSIAARSFPGPVYNLNFDNRMGSVANYYRARPHLLDSSHEQDDFDFFTDFDSLADKMQELERNCYPFKTIIFDPVTKLSDLFMSYQIKLRKNSGTDKSRKIGRIAMAQIEDYGGETRGFADLLDALDIIKNNQGINIVVIAHLVTIQYKTLKGEEKTEKLILTAGRKVAGTIPIRFDEVYNFYVESGFGATAYKVKTYNDSDVFARTSFAGMPGEIDWTNNNFYNLIQPHFGEKVIIDARESVASIELKEEEQL